MRRMWYHRMIWSYIPIFLCIGCFLFFIFFQMLTEQNKKDAMKANQVFTEQVQYFIDGALQSIDYTFILEMANNEWLRAFFESQDKDIYLLYRVTDRLKKLQQMNGLIDSVYLVRYEDGLVFNGNMLNEREPFPDNDFIATMKQTAVPSPWSNLRAFQPSSLAKPYDVITLVRKSTDNSEKGMVVVNVSTSALKRKIAEMYNDKLRFVGLYDRSGRPLFGTEDDRAGKPGVITSSVVSAYTGWEIRSGLSDGSLIQTASLLASIWTRLGLVALSLGILSIIYVTRRNYRPVADLLSRVRSLTPVKPSSASSYFLDEFALIGSTMEQMKEQTERWRQQYEDDLRVRVKFLFHELLNGSRSLPLGAWAQTMEELGLPPEFHRRQVAIAEIDRFQSFRKVYEPKDQSLMKFVIAKALQEIMQSQGLDAWADWTSEHRLGCVVTLCGEEDEKRFLLGCEQLQVWVLDNIRTTLTLGIGSTVHDPSQLSSSCKEAAKALQYKAATGLNTILQFNELAPNHTAKGEMLKYTPMLKRMTEYFRADPSLWRSALRELFALMKQDLLSRELIHIILQDVLHQLEQELSPLTKTGGGPWNTEELQQLREEAESLETLEEMEQAYYGTLEGIQVRVMAVLESNKTREILLHVRAYIEQQFANQELSLEHLGSTYRMNPKYLSQLFKQEFGCGFSEFLMDIRIRQAQVYLMETGQTVQDIAEQVGYGNPISFRRAFKKSVGVSPGDYRKCKGAPGYS